MLVYYVFIKYVFFFGLVRSFVKFDPLNERPVFLAALYTAGVAFLSFAFLLSPRPVVDWRGWEIWLGETFALSALYFYLLGRFGEGLLFGLLLLLGVGVVLF